MNKQELKALIFDVDGTLADNEHDGYRVAFNSAFKEAGLASALEAGITTVITVNKATRNQDFTGAAIIVDQLGEPDRPFRVLPGDGGSATFADIRRHGAIEAASRR